MTWKWKLNFTAEEAALFAYSEHSYQTLDDLDFAIRQEYLDDELDDDEFATMICKIEEIKELRDSLITEIELAWDKNSNIATDLVVTAPVLIEFESIFLPDKSKVSRDSLAHWFLRHRDIDTAKLFNAHLVQSQASSIRETISPKTRNSYLRVIADLASHIHGSKITNPHTAESAILSQIGDKARFKEGTLAKYLKEASKLMD